jgi:hypothetical protein
MEVLDWFLNDRVVQVTDTESVDVFHALSRGPDSRSRALCLDPGIQFPSADWPTTVGRFLSLLHASWFSNTNCATCFSGPGAFPCRFEFDGFACVPGTINGSLETRNDFSDGSEHRRAALQRRFITRISDDRSHSN